MKTLSPRQIAELQALEARFALRVGSALSVSAMQLPADVSERLRFAREQALGRRRQEKPQVAAEVVPMGAAGGLAAGPAPKRLLWIFASVLPWVLLAAGLFFIHEGHLQRQVQDAADIDAALLADDLPPAAYADPGFAAFLKAPPR